MAEYRQQESLLQTLGVGVIGLAVDRPEDARFMKETQQLPFAIVCDVDHSVVTRFGLLNRKERGGIAYPATFVLGKDRVVRFRSLDRTASRADISSVLEFLRAGLDSKPPQARQHTVWPRLADWYHAIHSAIRSLIRSRNSR